jgi:DNA repair exonuclease SbcCD nuclease subunit
MKIGIVGDLHIAPQPSSRIDDYFQNGLNKIEEISQTCDCVIFLGDIFTHSKVEERYINQLMRHLNYCKNTYTTQFYTIIGNHDVANEREDNLDNSSLGVLYNAGVLNIIQPGDSVSIDNYQFHTIPVNYVQAKQYLKDTQYTGNNNILLLHHEYETGTNCFCYNDLINKNCQMIFLGHDHKPMEGGRIVYPDMTVYRSGSIMRNRGDDYNFTRTLYYYILENGVVSCKAINFKPAQEVFKVEVLTKQNYNKQKFVQSLNEVIDKYRNNISTQSRFSIKNILCELGADTDIVDKIRKRYEKLGEVFE